MAYEEPGVKVIQQRTVAAANIKSAEQALVIVGDLYEVFDDEVHSQRYDATTDAGAQTFTWPGKKTSSVVDLAGVRKTTAEVDAQLVEYAPFPITLKLRDPDSGQTFDVDMLTDVRDINQTSLEVIEQSPSATAKALGTAATSSYDRELHLLAGGLIDAEIAVGDRVYISKSGVFAIHGQVTLTYDDNLFFSADGHEFVTTAAAIAGATSLVTDVVGDPSTDIETAGTLLVGGEYVAYSSVAVVGDQHTFTVAALALDHASGETVKIQIVDAPDLAVVDGDLATTQGFLRTASALTGKLDYRAVIWVEQSQVFDGETTASTNKITSATLTATIGQKLGIWSSAVGDGAQTQTDGVLTTVGGVGHLTSALATFATTDVGKPVKIGSVYRRVASRVSATEITYTGTPLTPADPVTYIVYGQVVRTIVAIDDDDFYVDGAPISSTMTTLPLILHRPVSRDLVTDVANDLVAGLCRYSGSAISSDTGYRLKVPVDIYANDVSYEVFPNYELLFTYRALDISSINDTMTVYEGGDLTTVGTVSTANPLLWAAQAAIVAMGTSDTPVYLLPVDLFAGEDPRTGYPEDQNVAGAYLNALDILEAKEGAYYLVPLTRNTTVRDAFVTHVLAMSEPCEKKERTCFLTYALPLGDLESTTGIIAPGLEGGNKKIVDSGQMFLSQHQLIPGNTVVITKPAAFAGTYVVGSGSTEDELVLEGDNWLQDDGGAYLATAKEFTDAAATVSAVANEVTSAVDEQWKDVEEGDYLLQGTATREITEISSDGLLTYAKLTYAGAMLPTTGTSEISILRTHVGVNFYARPLEKGEQASALKTISLGRGSFRVVHMWPDVVEMITGTDSQGNEVREFVSSIYAAAAEAGRCSVIRPERASTGVALAGFTALDHSNFFFKKAQLNTIAEGGWSILEQRVAGAPVLMRHLLTTNMSSVKTQEFSVTKNVDNMAKVKRASIEPLLNDEHGRVNITEKFLAALAFPLQGVFEYFKGKEQLVSTPGVPPYKILSIRIDPTAVDTILEDAELNVPIPANKITVTFVI